MLAFEQFQHALPLAEFLTKYGSAADQKRWSHSRERFVLAESQSALLKRFTRKMNVFVLAGAWCGDCAAQCPLMEKFAEAAPSIELRYCDRDASTAVQQELAINGGHRVPVAVFFSEDGHEVARYGERTLSAYRRLIAELGGESCGSGLTSQEQLGQIAQDWLNEFERVQWILRLSPRLRRLHGD
jgi:thiol-disulfide isomerase/thioredoxin